MNMLVMTLQGLGTSPLAWGAVGLLVLIAFFSVWKYARCPHLRGTAVTNAEEARAYLTRRVAAGPGYFLLMLTGIATLTAGLTMIAGDIMPDVGFFILIAGVAIVQTQPLRQRIRIAIARVAAASASDPDQHEVAQENLRDSHRSLVMMNFAVAAAVALGLLAF